MICPKCQFEDTKVLETRFQRGINGVKRRRECISCNFRFTTQEQLVPSLPMIVKKDGRREVFSEEKILNGLRAACQKRPISASQLEAMVDNISHWAQSLSDKEITSRSIGNMVMDQLKKLDEVAYIRFASVYKTFKDINEFLADLEPAKKLDKNSGKDLL